jgi:hypothetical protein
VTVVEFVSPQYRGLAFRVSADATEGCAQLTCMACGTKSFAADSEDFWEDAQPEVSCPCAGTTYAAAVGFALRRDSEVRRVALAYGASPTAPWACAPTGRSATARVRTWSRHRPTAGELDKTSARDSSVPLPREDRRPARAPATGSSGAAPPGSRRPAASGSALASSARCRMPAWRLGSAAVPSFCGRAASSPGRSLPERRPWPKDTPPRATSALGARDAQNSSSGRRQR